MVILVNYYLNLTKLKIKMVFKRKKIFLYFLLLFLLGLCAVIFYINTSLENSTNNRTDHSIQQTEEYQP